MDEGGGGKADGQHAKMVAERNAKGVIVAAGSSENLYIHTCFCCYICFVVEDCLVNSESQSYIIITCQ